MSLTNEERGVLVGAFIVVEGDEILSITAGGQVVRSPINDEFRPTGRDTMGVKFVTPKGGDSVAVVDPVGGDSRGASGPPRATRARNRLMWSRVQQSRAARASEMTTRGPVRSPERGAVDDPESEG